MLALRPADQQVVVGPKASLERTTLTASGVNWIVDEPDGAAARHGPDPPSASAPRPRPSGRSSDGRAEVVFDTPQIAITPGQAVVFYDGDVVVAEADGYESEIS